MKHPLRAFGKALFLGAGLTMCVFFTGCADIAQSVADEAGDRLISKPLENGINKTLKLDVPFQIYDRLSGDQIAEKDTLTIDGQVVNIDLNTNSWFSNYAQKSFNGKSGPHSYSIQGTLTMKDGTTRSLSGSGEIDVPPRAWQVFEIQLSKENTLVLKPIDMEANTLAQ